MAQASFEQGNHSSAEEAKCVDSSTNDSIFLALHWTSGSQINRKPWSEEVLLHSKINAVCAGDFVWCSGTIDASLQYWLTHAAPRRTTPQYNSLSVTDHIQRLSSGRSCSFVVLCSRISMRRLAPYLSISLIEQLRVMVDSLETRTVIHHRFYMQNETI